MYIYCTSSAHQELEWGNAENTSSGPHLNHIEWCFYIQIEVKHDDFFLGLDLFLYYAHDKRHTHIYTYTRVWVVIRFIALNPNIFTL